MRKKVAVVWNVMGAVALGMAALAASAQPMIQKKTVEIAKRSEHPVTRAGDLLTASVVTLHFHDAALREVLTAFAKQIDAGVTIEATNDGYATVPSLDWVESTRVSVNVVRASYWDALTAVVKAVPVKLDPQSRAGELVLVEHPDGGPWSGMVEQRDVFAMMTAPGARRVGALLFAPMAMETGRVTQKGKRLLVRAAVEPRVTGTSELAVLRLEALTASDGHSLLGEQHEFVTDENDYGGGDEWARWLFDMGEASADLAGVTSMRGELRIAAGSGQQGTFALSGMFEPTPPVPGEVQVDEECQIFRAPNFAVARGTYISRDRSFKNECRVVDSRHGVPDLDGTPRRRHVSYTEERTLVMHNVTDVPETFVVWTTFPPDEVRFTSNRKPKKVLDHGEYRVEVAPGDTERLHIAYDVNQEKKQRQPAVADVPLAPENLWQQVTLGEVRLMVKAVVPEAGEYVVRGEFSSAADGPVKYACPTHCQVLGTNDAEGRQILRQAAFGPIQRVDGRDVMEWSLTTAGRGLVPSKLEWGMEGVTRWVKVAVK
jgi:hypothetical protein